jgi:hypothetical protein
MVGRKIALTRPHFSARHFSAQEDLDICFARAYNAAQVKSTFTTA